MSREITAQEEDLSQQIDKMTITRSTSVYSRGYMEVRVKKPITHEFTNQARFTTYEISMETNNRAFTLQKACVRRRFSEFVWLRKQLISHFPDITPPALPPKKYFGGRFDATVIDSRVLGLEKFLSLVLDEVLYLSDSVLHLFLQSPLSIQGILDCIQGRSEKGVLETILDSQREMEEPSEVDEEPFKDLCSKSEEIQPGSPAVMSVQVKGSPGITSINSDPSDIVGTGSYDEQSPSPLSTATPTVSCLRRRQSSDVSTRSQQSDSDSDFCSDQSGQNSPDIDGSKKISKRTRRVTFSPEVTVAEVIDRFGRTPRAVNLSQVPSAAIASTVAY